MKVPEAIALVNTLVLRPDFHVSAEDYTNRFEDTICVHVTQDTRSSNFEDAPSYETLIGARAAFPVTVSTMTENDLVRAVIEILIRFETHELREFTRRFDDLVAPFHPHTVEGMNRWGDPSGDLLYGLA